VLPKYVVNGSRRLEFGGDIRIEHDDVRTRRVTGGILASHTLREIVFASHGGVSLPIFLRTLGVLEPLGV
jgi:hypothetical protein